MKRKKEEEQAAAPETEQAAAQGQAPAQPSEPRPEPDYYDQLLRLKADFENYRKRVDREKPELIAFGKQQVLCKILPVYDALLNARKALEKSSAPGKDGAPLDDLRKGLEMVYGELEKLFAAEGIKCMECQGKPFDPMCHEVLGVVEDDSAEEGLVHDELQRGFMAGDRVLRPARVRITRKKAVPAQQPAAEEKSDGK
ncbi:MAG: nucleotide exchange factor GrpE [Elusimicrobia bacterium]|nr:nucleotide exchange factor GrpE [Elusimicrobiota bacterium]